MRITPAGFIFVLAPSASFARAGGLPTNGHGWLFLPIVAVIAFLVMAGAAIWAAHHYKKLKDRQFAEAVARAEEQKRWRQRKEIVKSR